MRQVTVDICNRYDPLSKDARGIDLWFVDDRRGLAGCRAAGDERCGGGGGEGEVGDHAEDSEDQEDGRAAD